MVIYIDTNIFFKHWQLTNADFIYLFNYIENESETLLMSELVVSETESNRFREVEAAKALIQKNAKLLDQICVYPVKVDLSATERPYSFIEVLESKLEADYIEYLGYNDISQDEVVKRALEKKRPFRENEKGYRDTLIWLSFLKYLSENQNHEDAAFISANVKDFQNSKKTDFHEDLINDIECLSLKCKIKCYHSLASFIEDNFKKEEHLVTYNELDKVEDIIEEYTIDFLNNWSTEELKKSVITKWPALANLLSIEEHEFVMDEGVEDGNIVHSEHIAGRLAYLRCIYNLRRCSLRITISKEEYDLVKSSIPYHNTEEINGDFILIEVYARIYFNASFNYDLREKQIEGFTIQDVNYK